jgi:diguanylate cyclase (GGDEF)-like protein
MRGAKVTLLLVLLALVPGILATVVLNAHANAKANLDRSLGATAAKEQDKLASLTDNARATALLAAGNSAFEDAIVKGSGGTAAGWRQVNRGLLLIDNVYPGMVSTARFFTIDGHVGAMVVHGAAITHGDINSSLDRKSPLFASQYPFFGASLLIGSGHGYEGTPTLSATNGGWSSSSSEWVLPFASAVAGPTAKKPIGVVEFELSIEGIRNVLNNVAGGDDVLVVDGKTGQILLDAAHKQLAGAQLGDSGARKALIDALRSHKQASGLLTVQGQRGAWLRLPSSSNNANDLVLWVSAPAKTLSLNALAPLGIASLLLLAAALIFGRRWARTSEHAEHDALTGLGNRRKLLADIERRVARATPERPLLLVLYDLDGFKNYNDNFGHPAGDALLARLGRKLERSLEGRADAYRLGGDEFCLLGFAAPDETDAVLEDGRAALTEAGEGFEIGASAGRCLLPQETDKANDALGIADQNLYSNKTSARRSASRQSTDVLLQVVRERTEILGEHLDHVAELAVAVARTYGLSQEELDQVRGAAELHDIGKMAVPDEVLNRAGVLDPEDWELIHQHPLVGARIVSAAPSLEKVSLVVRATHERWDGTGYPDGLAGDAIPLAARIVAVCNAFDALTGERPYREGRSETEALDELRRHAGTQFDPDVVERFCTVRVAEPQLSLS